MENQRGRSRKRKISPAKKAMNIFKRTVVAVLCFAMVAEYVPSSLSFAAEGTSIIEGEAFADNEVTLDDLTQETAEGDTVSDNETGTGIDDEADAESDPDEEGGSEEGAGEVTGDDEDEGTPDSEETPDSEDDADDENAGSDGEEDEKSEEDAESENEADDEYTDADDEENAEGEDEDEEAEDEEIVEEEEAAAGAGAAVVPSTSAVTSYKTVSATIYMDDTYEEKLSDGATIELSGKMPKEAEVKAYPVEVEIEDITILAAYDITIFDEDGEEYEPDEDDVIEVTIENDEIREALEEERELTVFHMYDEDDEPEEIAKLPPKTKKPKFSARHFSIYIVGENGSLTGLDGEAHYVYTVNFYLPDSSGEYDTNNTPWFTQKVSAGESLVNPGVPDKEDYHFDGWYTEPTDGEKFDVSAPLSDDIVEDTTINLYGRYTSAVNVHFMRYELSDDENEIFYIEQFSYGSNLNTQEAEQLYLSRGYLSYQDEDDPNNSIITKAITGWQDINRKKWTEADTITEDIELYPILENAYWIYFDMNGHDSITNPEPEYVLEGDKIGNLPDVEVSGYAFKGWYTDAEDGIEVKSDTDPSTLTKNNDGSITLYAHWSEGAVAYTINIWRQKATDGKTGIDRKNDNSNYGTYIEYYDYAESIPVTVDQSQLKTGDSPAAENIFNWSTYTGYGTITDTTNNYYGFEYNQTRTVSDLSRIGEEGGMSSDGSTIINIFYDRVTITWTFSGNIYNNGELIATSGTLIGLYGTNTDQGTDPCGTLSSWPDPGDGYRWHSETYDIYFAYETEFVILEGSTEFAFESALFSNASGYFAYYYLEVTNSDQVDSRGDKASEASGYGIPYELTYKESEDSEDEIVYVYDRRIELPHNFPTEAESQTAGYTYFGYYLVYDEDATAYYGDSGYFGTGDIVTPDNDADLKCYYILNKAVDNLTITFLSNNAINNKVVDTYTGKYGEVIDSLLFPTDVDATEFGPADYYNFSGWYADETCNVEFSLDTMPNNNVVAYAKWVLKEITVTFDTGTSDVTAPNEQTIKASEKAQDPGSLERDGYTLVGWGVEDDNGKITNLFNFETVLYDDINLKAIWQPDDETGYIMKYDLNISMANMYGLLGGYEGDTVSYNPEHFIEDEELWTIETAFSDLSENYNDDLKWFVGWNTQADATGTMYYPDETFESGDAVTIESTDYGDAIVLYAVWTHENQSTLYLNYNYPEGFTPEDGERSEYEIPAQANLSVIELSSSAEGFHDEDIEIDGVRYQFKGWSTEKKDATKASLDDVMIDIDASVAVDNIKSENNVLYAVWVAVYDITVTKVVDNPVANYTVPEDQTFEFTYSVNGSDSGAISIADKENFVIENVMIGDEIIITESKVDTKSDEVTYDTSFEGATDETDSDKERTYVFVMNADSTEITVTNTVIINTNILSVTKEWSDDDTADHSEDSVIVYLYEDGEQFAELELNSDNGWYDSVKIFNDGAEEFTVKEKHVSGYNSEINYLHLNAAGREDIMAKITNTPYSFNYYPLDEEIVPEESDRTTWEKTESVNEYNAIEFEMSTYLPQMTAEDLSEGEFTMLFHNELDSNLLLDDDEGNDLHITIGGEKIDPEYYDVEILTNDVWTISTMAASDDGCTFHVTVDLTALYNDEVITEDQLDGNTEIIVYFFADLEGTGLNGSYKSTVWYDVYDGDVLEYSSDPVYVEVYTFEIDIFKYDTSNNSALEGATFGIYYDEEGSNAVNRNGSDYTVVSDENGSAIFYGLAEGTYYVKEISAPSGYELNAEVLTIILDDSLTDHVYGTEFGNTPTSTDGGDDNPDNGEPDDEGNPDEETEPGPVEEPDDSGFTPTKSVDKGEGITVYYGDSLTYTITYKNTADEAATITITDTLNSGLTFSSASDGGEYDSASRTVTWTLENVEAGHEGSVTLTATVNLVGRTNGSVSNTAYVKVGDGEAVEASNAVTNPVYRSTSSGSSGSSGSSSGSATTVGHVRNVNNGKTGHWILEGGYLTLPDGSHPSNEYLDVDGEVWAFYTYGYAVAKRHTQYYTDEAISAVGYIPRVTGTWEVIGWWFEYDDGTYPHDEWALLEYNGLTYWYHFDVDGWMDDGWFIDKNGDTYYLDPVYDGWRGHMMTGWQLIGGYWYYFSEDPNSLGVMLKDTTTPDGFKVDGNGRYVE